MIKASKRRRLALSIEKLCDLNGAELANVVGGKMPPCATSVRSYGPTVSC
jgi:hypothetical protein